MKAAGHLDYIDDLLSRDIRHSDDRVCARFLLFHMVNRTEDQDVDRYLYRPYEESC